MFKVVKYLFIANLYKRAKKSILFLSGSFIALILTTFLINDVIAVASGMSVYILLLSKWIMIVSLLIFIGFQVVKIINIASSPFSSSADKPSDGTKKENILNKEKIYTKSDLIVQKYMKDEI